MAYSKIILNGETLMDVTSDTVAAGSLLSGKTATKNDGTKVTGNIANKTASDLTASGATVTAAAGYYPSAVSKAVATTTHPNPTAAIASSTGVVTATHTQTTGYVTSGTTTGTLSLTTKAAATINTSTADQTIASYRWLTGTQTIKSVTTTNLTAANIASGVVVKVGDANNASRITQVTGTYAPAVSSVTVTPTETTQTFNATGVYGYKPVTVNGISSTYVGTGIARKSSADVAFASATATFTAPIGYYSAAATKTLTTQAAQTIYPSTADQTVASYRWLTGTQTIKSVVTSNLTAENIAEGVVIKIGDANNASRITQVTGTYEGGADLPVFTITRNDSDWSVLSVTCDMSYSECLSKYSGGEWGAVVNEESASHEYDYSYCATCQSGEGDNPDAPSGHRLNMYYDIPFGDGIIGAAIVYYGNGDIEYVEPYYTKSTLNVTANGTYSSYFSLYDVVNVNVQGAQGYTIDEIATKAISGSISGNATSISWFTFNNTSITTASFPNCLSIGQAAFYYCRSLSSIYFPSCTYISSSGFCSCNRLTEVSFSKCTTVGDNAFAYCTSLTSAIFPACTSISANAFSQCFGLTNISFPECTYIGAQAFHRCSALTSVNFPKCSYIGMSAFSGCVSLISANFPLCNSVNGKAFVGCTNLKIVSILTCASIAASAFSGCYNLISLYLNNVSAIPTLGTNPFYSTPISTYSTVAGRYGSIFVPSSLYTAFTTATGWTAYSARMVSV